jgi:hypothetical protein
VFFQPLHLTGKKETLQSMADACIELLSLAQIMSSKLKSSTTKAQVSHFYFWNPLAH